MAQDPLLNIAVSAARAAGRIIMRSADRIDSLTINTKQRNDFVSEVDVQAEQAIIQTIHKAYPAHGILGEESGTQNDDADVVWVIDPLDGTTNYLRGFPHYAVSIAAKVKGKLSHAVVYDPSREEMFVGSRGAGARLNDRRLRVTPRTGIDDALLGTGFPFRNEQHLDEYLAMFKDIYTRCSEMRRAGCAALDLAYVAAGRLDGFWEIGLKQWDWAGGALLVREAGGMVGDFTGGEGYWRSGNIVAGAPKLFADLIKTIRPHLTEGLR
ncbi:MAG: inositol monophosphatase [Gammaproteobacteria bacterium]|nr:inositol monophosphatase [Gammaproteobacteria bacterium]